MAVEPQQNLDQPKEGGRGAGAGHHDKTHGNWVMTHPYDCDVDKSPPSKGNLCADIDVHLANSFSNLFTLEIENLIEFFPLFLFIWGLSLA